MSITHNATKTPCFTIFTPHASLCGPFLPYFHNTLPFTISFNHAHVCKPIDSNALPFTTSFNHVHLLKPVNSKTIKLNYSQIKTLFALLRKWKNFLRLNTMAPPKKTDYAIVLWKLKQDLTNSTLPPWIRNPNETIRHITHQKINFDFFMFVDAKNSTNLLLSILWAKQINLSTHM
jgi:hypothetical protein